MIFIDKLQKLLSTYDKGSCEMYGNAFLYGCYETPPPLASHFVFPPMPESTRRTLVENYNLPFPDELLHLYEIMNGADLFWTVYSGSNNIRIPVCQLAIYGVPLTIRDPKFIEPFNISVEDLCRPKETPLTWLKFASYNIVKASERWDLFVDTYEHSVTAVKHGEPKCRVVATWDSIDKCLCCLLELLEDQGQGDGLREPN